MHQYGNYPIFPKIKICGITNFEDAIAAARFGADALGFRIRPKLSKTAAKSIITSLPPFITSVLLIRSLDTNDPIKIADLSNYLGISTLQIYTDFSIESLDQLRDRIPGFKLIRAIGVTGPETVEEATELQKVADALLLDTFDTKSGNIGGTGKTHDWVISRKIVERVSVPVILAGGLTEENIKDAMIAVNPWGIDCETGVEKSNGLKDHEKLKNFILKCKSMYLSNL
ncbi:MAG: phosphoribosylanthranilate isomerase [Anaerolineales bacterium]|nr:phosphoribosylanthranilate isomerase [Anaerolineales bacterium]